MRGGGEGTEKERKEERRKGREGNEGRKGGAEALRVEEAEVLRAKEEVEEDEKALRTKGALRASEEEVSRETRGEKLENP